MTEFERFGLSGKKKLREAETLTRQINSHPSYLFNISIGTIVLYLSFCSTLIR